MFHYKRRYKLLDEEAKIQFEIDNPEIANWDEFLMNKLSKGEEKGDGHIEGDKDNLWMTVANPYMKAVKHDEAAKDSQKNKKPVWIGPKSLNYNKVPKVTIEKGVERNNRNLATLNMLNWFTHNSYVEIPMSQRMALYFDSKAVDSVSSGTGTLLSFIFGGMGIGGIIGGMMGGPLGGVFGAAAGRMGSRLLKPLLDEAAITSSRMNYWNGYWICLE